MIKQFFFLGLLILSIFPVVGQVDGTHQIDSHFQSNDDSLALHTISSDTKGEVFVTIGYLNAVRSDGAFNYESASIGAGVELSPGKVSIGISALFAYRSVTEKFFNNLYYPQIQLYGLYSIWRNDPHHVNVGMGLSYLTNVFTERWVFNGEEFYLRRFENQNVLALTIKSNYKFYLPIGQRKQGKLSFSAFFDVGIPVVVFSVLEHDPYTSLEYDNWLYRLGFIAGFRFGFGM